MKQPFLFVALPVFLPIKTITMKKIIALAGLILTGSLAAQKNKIDQDRESIKSMCGIYKVTFDFAETFSPDTAYKYHDRYSEHGIEQVTLVEETPTRVVLQHLLIIDDSTVIKHWRQDWVYENRDIYNYVKDNEWKKTALTAEQAKGTWTQKVFQVDDSPRYESYGTWVHIDGKHYWEGVNDSPLPRREFTKRNDYNVMRRHIRMEVFKDGNWVYNQDNEKMIRENGKDKLLVWEKGIESFTRGKYDASPALRYWEKQKNYWADVRAIWDEVYQKNPDLTLAVKVDNKRLYERLFELGENACKSNSYTKGSAKTEIKKIIDAFLKAV